MLEKELQEVITLTSTELEEYQEKVLELEDEVNHQFVIIQSGGFWNTKLLSIPFCVILITTLYKLGSHYLHLSLFINDMNSFHSFKSRDASRNGSGS